MTNKNQAEEFRLRVWVAFFGLCLSGGALLSEQLINRDGILYLEGAQIFIDSGFDAAFSHYSWPFYSILIAVFDSITTIGLENSARLINAALLLVLVDAFIRVYWEVNSKVIFRWMPALIILCYSGINDYRLLIIRDWGYWAFLLLASLYLIRAYKYNKLEYYIWWQVFMLGAFLFRIEAIAVLFLAPLIFLIRKEPIVRYLKACSFGFIIGLIMVFVDMAFYGESKLQQVFSYLDFYSSWVRFGVYANRVAEGAIQYYVEDYSIVFTISGLLSVLLGKVLAKVGGIYFLVFFIGFIWHKVKNSFHGFTVNALIAVSFIIVFLFFLNSRVIAGRYTVQIVLFLLFYVTYYSEAILEGIKKTNHRWLEGAFFMCFFINLAIGMHHSASNKMYLKEMGVWVRHNTLKSAYITTNDRRLFYYSGGVEKERVTLMSAFAKNDYALLNIDKNDKKYSKLISENKLFPIHAVDGGEKGSAILFKINMAQ